MAKQITEEQIAEIAEKLVDRIEKANLVFLKKIGSSIKSIKQLTPTQAMKLIQILKYGGEYDKIIKELSKQTNMNVQDIDKIFSAYAKKDQEFYKEFYQYRNKPYIPFEQNTALKTQTMALANISKQTMYNFTNSSAIGYTINGEFFDLRKTYETILDTALINISQGKETFDSGMRDILKQIGGSGLRTLEYESGRSIRLDSAVRMHVKDALQSLHNENQKMFGREFDSDGVEISVHLNPAPDHALVQGRQFSNEEFDKFQNDQDAKSYNGILFPAISGETGRDRRSIGQYNCYHKIFPIILGVSNPEYTDEQLQQILEQNEQGFEFEGKHYTNYEGTQLQRKLEAEIRKQKDIQILAKESGNEELIGESQKNITALSHKYKKLSDTSGLPMQRDRLRVSGYKKIKTQINNDLSRNTKNLINFKNQDNKNIGYLGRLDISNNNLINKKIKEYRESILMDIKESAYLIDNSGDVFKINGTTGTVPIPDWLDQKNGIVIHNHTPDKTHYSFSKEDIDWFTKKEIKKLYGDDTTFEYVIERLSKTPNEIKELTKEWAKHRNEALNKAFRGELDIDIDEYDYIVKQLSKNYNFNYKRNIQSLK